MVSTGPSISPFRYAAQYTDAETGLVYLRARYYEPGTGPFLTVDPMFDVTRERYGYVGGNPLNSTDPLGLCWGPGCWVEDAWDSTGGQAVSWVADTPGKALTYTAITLGGTALIIGTGGFGAGLAAGSATTCLGIGSSVATGGAIYYDCKIGSGPCAAGFAELSGGVATTLLGRVPGASLLIRNASNAFAFLFDVTGLENGRLAC